MKLILSLIMSAAITLLITSNSFAEKMTLDSIENQIKQNDKTIVHIHAAWCPSCKVQKSILGSIKDADFKLIEVDFDLQKDFLNKYKIFQQSMLISFNNGKEVKRVFGITKKDKIMTFINDSFNTPLQDAMNERQASSASKKPEKAKLTMQQATEELRASGIIEKAINEGGDYIDFELPNIEGKTVKISDKLKDGPVVLTFYRGGWCPYCNMQLKAYQDNLEHFEKAGGQLIAISPESMESANSTVDANDIKFEILTDNMNKIARQYGLVFKLNDDLKDVYLQFGLDLEKNQGNDSWELPIAATYIISPSGKIEYAFLNVDYVQRAEPADIIRELHKLN